VAPPGTPRLLRALNDRTALDLLLEHGSLTRTRLGELTGLSKPTASQLLSRLEAAGLVEPAGTTTGSPGPNAQVYRLRGSAGFAAGVDVTPYTAVAEVVDLAGTPLGRAAVSLPRAAGARTPVSDVTSALDAASRVAGVDRRRLGAVVVGAQGAHDPHRDTLAYGGHVPGWSRPGLMAGLTAGLSVPVTVENDVNLAAAAERAALRSSGHDQPVDCSALLWMGDGLGLAVHLGGALHRGASGGAGEIGYMPVPHPDRPGTAALQDLVGGPAVLRLARTHGITGRRPEVAVARAVDRAGDRAAGDHAAATFLALLADRVATGLATIVAVLDPDLVVLAGPIGQAGGPLLRDLVRDRLTRISPLRPRIAVTEAGPEPVLAGAVAMALDACRERVFAAASADATLAVTSEPPPHTRLTGASR
jgi:predicted NBD/HSP70 family sugar kinase